MNIPATRPYLVMPTRPRKVKIRCKRPAGQSLSVSDIKCSSDAFLIQGKVTNLKHPQTELQLNSGDVSLDSRKLLHPSNTHAHAEFIGIEREQRGCASCEAGPRDSGAEAHH